MCKRIFEIISVLASMGVLITIVSIGEYEIWKHNNEEAEKEEKYKDEFEDFM